MKLKFYKIFPYIEIKKKLEPTVLGSSKYFLVWLDPDKATKQTDEHEEVHILFWWVVTILGTIGLSFFIPWWLAIMYAVHIDPILGSYVKPYKVFEESVAYARAATLKEDPEAYLEALSRSRLHIDKYGQDFYKKVKKKMSWWQ